MPFIAALKRGAFWRVLVNESLDPLAIGLFRAAAVMPGVQGLPQPIEQLRFLVNRTSGTGDATSTRNGRPRVVQTRC
jgi:hypothetical protein